jgi:hypothetical protein
MMETKKPKLNRKQRTAKRRERIALGLPAPAPTPAKIRRTVTHGQIPDAAEGWVADQPKQDPTLRISRITVVRYDDGNTQKFYLMSVSAEEIEQMKKRAKRTARRIKRENEAAAKKEARRAARAVLFALGKQF